MRKKIGIIGGAGFLGTRLTDRLKSTNHDYKVFDIDDKNIDTFKVDVTDLSSLSQLSQCDVLINLAAVHRDDIRPTSLYDEVNVSGAQNICTIARRHNINKIIFTSSVAVYGFSKDKISEDGKHNYFNDYGRTKHLAEKIFKEWFDENPKDRMLFIVRPTVIFGEGNRGNVYNLLRQIYLRQFVMLGNGRNTKSMAYVENVAAFLEHAIGFNNGFHLYNYVDKPDFDMNLLVSRAKKILFGSGNVGIRLPAFIANLIGLFVDLLAKITGKSFPVSGIRIKKFMETTHFDTSLDQKAFQAPVTLNEGLERTLRYEFLEDNKKKRTFFTE